jgi:hypothetical protein
MTNSITLTGLVTDVRRFSEKGPGCGFAFAGLTGNAAYPRVLLLASKCRRVEGPWDKPTLTPEPAKVDLTHHTKVIMEAVLTERGAKAVRWGLVPKRDDLKELLTKVRLRDYASGTVHVFGRHEDREVGASGPITDLRLSLRENTFRVSLIDGERHCGLTFYFDRELSAADVSDQQGTKVIQLQLVASYGSGRITVYIYPQSTS